MDKVLNKLQAEHGQTEITEGLLAMGMGTFS